MGIENDADSELADLETRPDDVLTEIECLQRRVRHGNGSLA